MFNVLLKLRKEAHELDQDGLVKQANTVDSRITKISHFLANIHTLDLPSYLMKKLAFSKWLNEVYLRKTGQGYGEVDVDDPEFRQDQYGYEDEDYGEDEGYSIIDDEDEDDGSPGKPKRKTREEGGATEFHTSLYDYGLRNDRRFALNLTSAPITDENGQLLPGAIEDNPEGFLIYLIAHKEERDKPEYARLRKAITGNGPFASITEKEAQDILEYYKRPQNREAFPGMTLDLFAQLLQRAQGRPVEDQLINGLMPSDARIELYGYDPEEEPDEGDEEGEISRDPDSMGRMKPVYEFFKRQNMGAKAHNSIVNYYKNQQARIEEQVSQGRFADVAGAMLGTAISNAKWEDQEGTRVKTRYPYVRDVERKLVGGDAYGVMLAESLNQLAATVGYIIEHGASVPEQVVELARKSWNFADLASSPFAKKGSNPAVASKFSPAEKQDALIREVIAEEVKKKNTGHDYIPFFVDNPVEVVMREIDSLGMLLRFQEYVLKREEEERLNAALESFKDKLEYNAQQRAKYEKALASGKKAKLKQKDTSEEEQIIQRSYGGYQTIVVDPKSGRLSFKSDTTAVLEDRRERRKEVIRKAGMTLGKKGGKDEMNRMAVNHAIEIARKYTHAVKSDQSMQALVGGGKEGDGTAFEAFVADEQGRNPLELLLDASNESSSEEDRLKARTALEAWARPMFRYLANTRRVLPGKLAFAEAFFGESTNKARYEQYLAAVADMLGRMKYGKDQTSDYSSDEVVDEEWKARIESQNGGKVIEHTEVDRVNGQVIITFKDSDEKLVLRDDLPRTQEELKEQDVQEEAQARRMSQPELIQLARTWLRGFRDAESVIDRESYSHFCKSEPGAAGKEAFRLPEVGIARSVIMDDEFHNKVIELYEKMPDEQKKAFSKKYAIKLNRKWTPGIFIQSRLVAYMQFVCGVDPIPISAIILEGDTSPMLDSYAGIVRDYYGTYRSEGWNEGATDEEVSAIFSKPPGNRASWDKGKGEQGRKRRLSISNEDGSYDADNVLYLASQHFDRGGTLLSGYTAMGYSPKRAKAYYLMRLKSIMDMFRLQTAGRDVIDAIFRGIGRLGDTVFNASTAMGFVQSQYTRYINDTDAIMESFRDDINEKKQVDDGQLIDEGDLYVLPEGEPIQERARLALAQLRVMYEGIDPKKSPSGRAKIGHKEKLDGRVAIFTALKAFDSDIGDYLSGFSIGGEPIDPVDPSNAIEQYDRYAEYVEARYGEDGSRSYRPQFVQSLASSVKNLSDKEDKPVVERTPRDLVDVTEKFTIHYQECVEELEYHVTTGQRFAMGEEDSDGNDSDGVADPNSVTEKANRALEQALEERRDEGEGEDLEPDVDEVVEDTEVTQEPLPTPKAPAPAPQPAAPPVAVAPAVQPVQQGANMQRAFEYASKYPFGKAIPKDSPDIQAMMDLGFVFGPRGPNEFSIRQYPNGYFQYIQDQIAKKRQSRNASVNINDFIVFGDKEIDFILKEYWV